MSMSKKRFPLPSRHIPLLVSKYDMIIELNCCLYNSTFNRGKSYLILGFFYIVLAVLRAGSPKQAQRLTYQVEGRPERQG